MSVANSVPKDFNPRSHEGSDNGYRDQVRAAAISIHAPTRGATVSRYSERDFTFISIHAPTRGATCSSGSDTLGIMISIHAPTRGATEFLLYLVTLPQISIHAPTRGATEDEQNEIVTLLFQSTLPRGERHRGGCRGRGYFGFQSTLPRGERL